MTPAQDFDLDTSLTANRELSWLKFNERVLQMANDLSCRFWSASSSSRFSSATWTSFS
jgi:hypothetical protein